MCPSDSSQSDPASDQSSQSDGPSDPSSDSSPAVSDDSSSSGGVSDGSSASSHPVSDESSESDGPSDPSSQSDASSQSEPSDASSQSPHSESSRGFSSSSSSQSNLSSSSSPAVSNPSSESSNWHPKPEWTVCTKKECCEGTGKCTITTFLVPAEQGCPPSTDGPIFYYNGQIKLTRTDVGSTGFGAVWGHSRSFNNRMSEDFDYGNGFNWQVEQWPYVVPEGGAALVIVRIEARSLWFDDVGGGTYVGRWGILDTLTISGDYYVVTAPDGTIENYYRLDGVAHGGHLASRVSPNGEAVTLSYDAFDRIVEAERTYTVDGVTRSQAFTYTYGAGDHSERIASVTLRLLDERGWSQTQRALYTYYDANDPNGLLGDLQSATRQLRREGIGWEDVGTDYYRYYKGGAGEPGFAHALKYVLSPEAYARLVAAHGKAALAPDAVVATYADNYFEYDDQSRVVLETTAGGRETVTLAYTTNPDPSYVDGPNNWKFKTVVVQPDGSLSTVYANYLGLEMLKEESDAAVTQRWIWYSQFNDDYRVVLRAEPSAVDLSASPVYNPSVLNLNVQLYTAVGLITTYEYYDGTDGPAGYSKSRSVQEGLGGAPNLQETAVFDSHTAGGVTVYPLVERIMYRADAGADPVSTTYAYEFYSGTNQILQKTTTLPTVPTAENGSNTTTVQQEQYDLFGNMTWEQGPRGFIDFFSYDVTTGTMTERIRDVDPATVTLPSGWTRPAGLPAPLNLVTSYEQDALGRVIQELGPSHDVDGVTVRTARWTVYHDAAHETMSAQGTAAIEGPGYAYAVVNPVMIARRDRSERLVDQIQAVRTAAAGRLCLSNEFPQGTWVAWSRDLYDDGGRLVASRAYHTIPEAGEGSAGANYNETAYGYDARGRRNRTRAPGGTITRTTLDVLGRTTSTWVGTADVGATDEDPGAGGSGNNMVPISSRTFSGDCACGQPASQTLYVDDDTAHDRVTNYTYDYRNRLIEIDGEADFFEARSYDNLNHLTHSERRIGSSSGTLIAQTETYFDVRGQVYKTEQYGADGSGFPTAPLVGLNWYDEAGNLVAAVTAGAKDLRAFTKSEFDGDGRNTATYATVYTGSLPPSYTDATTVTNSDRVFEQTEITYDPASNVTLTTTYSRFPDSSAVNKLTTADARRFKTATWYDGVGRPTATGEYGTSDDARPSNSPASTDAVPVTLMRYNLAGRTFESVDPMGRATRREYDALGRVTATIANATGCSCPGNDTDVTVRQAYDADGHLVRLTAENPTTGPQTTTYLYGVTPSASALASNDLLAAVIYPDAVDGADRVTYAYNRQGQQTRITDQNGTVRELAYDKLGRQTADRVAEVGSGVDGTVRRLETVYDTRQRVETRSSYSAATGGSVVNQLQYEYDNFGQVAREYQSHSGAVNTGTTPYVDYAHDDATANTIRATSVTYPSGRVLDYAYGTSGSDDDRLSRVFQLKDGSTVLAQYDYLGSATFARCDYSEPQIRWDLSPSGNSFSGLDSLNRTVDCLWRKYAPTVSDPVRIGYTYDRASNRTSRDVAGTTGNDELYRYDGLNRLTDLDRGNLGAGKITDPQLAQEWRLDATGNWNRYENLDFVTPGSSLDQNRTANQANEIIDFASTVGATWAQPAYDRAGNMNAFPQSAAPTSSYSATYDAWNRLTALSDGSSYAYDPLNRRTVQVAGGVTRHYYYSTQWQVLEERLGTSPDSASAERQFVWGQRYIDDLVLRDRSPTNNATLSERLYALQDANWNVVAVTDDGGDVQERYRYSAYGTPTFLQPDFTPRSPDESDVDWETLYCGYRWDAETGLYQVRWRYLNSTVGRWITRDPRFSMHWTTDNSTAPIENLEQITAAAASILRTNTAPNSNRDAYMYCLDNPATDRDPSGLISFGKCDECDCVLPAAIFAPGCVYGANMVIACRGNCATDAKTGKPSDCCEEESCMIIELYVCSGINPQFYRYLRIDTCLPRLFPYRYPPIPIV